MAVTSQQSHFSHVLAAPCGMNCGTCIAHLRAKNTCSGCNSITGMKVNHCSTCRIKQCPELLQSKKQFCFICSKFPCKRLRQLDKRYRTKYGMSMIDNLRTIEKIGVKKFMIKESTRWKCSHCGAVISAHRPECLVCGIVR
jgi:hypothetical protein